MNSIIKKFTSLSEVDDALDNTDFGQKILDGILPYIQEYADKNSSIQVKLSDLLAIGSLPAELVNILIRPWHRAQSLSQWCRQCNLSEEKTRVKNKIKELEQFKQSLEIWPKISLSFQFFLTSTIPDIDTLISHLNEIQQYLKDFNSISFKRGSAYSPEYLEKHGINSVFWIGKQMGLAEIGKPTQLTKFIKLVTASSLEYIGKCHYNFNQTEYIDEYNANKNTALSYIFNPNCNSTNNILNSIRSIIQSKSID